MLSEKEKEEIRNVLKEMKGSVTIMFFKDESSEFERILEEITKMNDKIFLEVFSCNSEEAKKLNVQNFPMITFKERQNIKFFGFPYGYEFSVFLANIVAISNKKIDISKEVANEISKIDKNVNIKVFTTPFCPYCPKAAYVSTQFSLINDKIVSEIFDVSKFNELAEKYNVFAVPKVVINDKIEFEGAVHEKYFLKKILEAI
jgi:glutaredoxin-like protein